MPWQIIVPFQSKLSIGGRIAEENPDLPYSLVRDILLADQEEIVGEYQFG